MCHRPGLEVNIEINVNMVSKDAVVLLLILLPTVATILLFKLHRSFWIKEDFCHLHSYELLDDLALVMFMPCCLFSSTSSRSQNSVSHTKQVVSYLHMKEAIPSLFTCTTVNKQLEAKSHSLGEQLPPRNRILIQYVHHNLLE